MQANWQFIGGCTPILRWTGAVEQHFPQLSTVLSRHFGSWNTYGPLVRRLGEHNSCKNSSLSFESNVAVLKHFTVIVLERLESTCNRCVVKHPSVGIVCREINIPLCMNSIRQSNNLILFYSISFSYILNIYSVAYIFRIFFHIFHSSNKQEWKYTHETSCTFHQMENFINSVKIMSE